MTDARILIVEDELIVAMDIRNTLEHYGFVVAGQTDRGEDAIIKARDLRPDLILMDINLRGVLDGIEAAIQIRTQFNLPVIFLTAFGNSTMVERARLAEPFAYIFKPFDERELVSNIEMALHKHEMERKVRASEDKFRSVIQHSSDGIVLADKQGNLIEWNRAAERISGLMRPDVLGKPLWEVIFHMLPVEQQSSEMRDEFAVKWSLGTQDGYASGLDQLTEMEIETPQGSRRIVQTNGFLITTSEKLIAGTIMRDVTEYKQGQEAILNSERRFRALIEHGRDNISLLSAEGDLLWESPSITHTLGYAHNQFLGRSIFELMHPDDQQWTRNLFLQVVRASGSSQEGVFRLLRSDGSWRWIEATATNLLQEPVVRAIIINYRDITDRKQAEEKLLIKEAAIASSINAIALSDLHGSLNYVNKSFVKLWGFENESEVLNKSVTMFWTDKEQAAGVMKALQLEGSWLGEMPAKKQNGSPFDAQVSAHLVRGLDGKPICFMASFLDITERKRAEAELRKLSQAVEQSANAVVITDTDGHIEYANPKFVEVSGYPLSEVLGKTPRILNSGTHDKEFYRNLWQTIKAGEVWRGEVRNRRKDGTLYWEDSTITPIFDSTHKLVNFIALKEDITVRKALEETELDQRKLAEALRDTSAALNGTLNLDEVLDRVLQNIEKVTPFDAALILTIDGHSVRKVRQYNKFQKVSDQSMPGNTQSNLINIPILQQIRETQQPCLIPDIQADVRWRAIPGMTWIRSLISAPVIIRGQVAGLINILSATSGFFTPAHAERLSVFSSQVAIAMNNAQLFEQAHHLSVTDSLTELMNRRQFFEVARTELERSRRYRRSLSAMMIDVDHFKTINDTYGHAVGDLALREVARRIKHSVRSVDVVARYGGEEFIVLMPEIALQEACQVAERVRRSVSDEPIEEDTLEIRVTLSIGVAGIDEQSSNMDILIRYADLALYNAKMSGRNRVESYQSP